MSYPLAHFNAAVDSVVEGGGHEGIRFHLTLGIVHGCKKETKGQRLPLAIWLDGQHFTHHIFFEL